MKITSKISVFVILQISSITVFAQSAQQQSGGKADVYIVGSIERSPRSA
jgi:hypothetical protein